MKRYMRRFIAWIFLYVLKAHWIIDVDGSLGIRIAGVCMYYYKWPNPLFYISESVKYRMIEDKEFGESIRSERKF